MIQNTKDACCGPTCCGTQKPDAAATITAAVRKTYGDVANSTLSNKLDGVRAVAEAFGYSSAELTSIPDGANMGLSCGNPTATANLRPGEVVVDLGSGGGLDVFLAAENVGPTGKAIGIDMTPAMIERARRNAQQGPDGEPYGNVEFHLATIDKLPLPDASVDVVISNCVINLAPDKSAVFREIARVLKPGGRVAVSDIVLKKMLPRELAENSAAWCGCIAGAVPVADYIAGLNAVGLSDVVAVDDKADLNAYAKVEGQVACCSPATTSSTLPVAGCCKSEDAPALHADLADLLRRFDINEFAASMKVYAVKPL
jgi:ubiquinone/menaquinone biosynthesis C-methylase UbiE